MLPYVNIFGKAYPMYGIMALLAITTAICFGVFYFSKYYDIKKEDVFYSSIFALIGSGIGAKLLYIITILPNIVNIFNQLGVKSAIITLMKGGFVFYGGLFGGILGIYIYAKKFKVLFKKLITILIPTTPILHAIGRIGCLCAGCCYGKEYHGFGSIIFYNSEHAPNGIPLFPTQIVGSICNLIIFIILIITYKKYIGTYKTMGLYFILYSIVRFILEFFRGDLIRGIILGLSTSQWISIIIFIIGILIFYKERNNKQLDNNLEKK